jgi:hypothetical protein
MRIKSVVCFPYPSGNNLEAGLTCRITHKPENRDRSILGMPSIGSFLHARFLGFIATPPCHVSCKIFPLSDLADKASCVRN